MIDGRAVQLRLREESRFTERNKAMKLIDDIRDDWKVATKWASVRLSGLGVVLTGAWAVLPADLRAQMPYIEILAPVLFALVIVGRVTTTKGASDGE